jgi:hypothetical protein
MEDDEVGVPGALSDRDVIPAQVVVFQFVFEAGCESLFAGGHSGQAGAESWDERCHGCLLGF